MRLSVPFIAILTTLALSPAVARAQAAWEDGSEEPEDTQEAPDSDLPEADSGATSKDAEPETAADESDSEPTNTTKPTKKAGPRTVEADTVIVLKTEEPKKLEKVRRRLHDGFYLRSSLGGGFMATRFSDDLLANDRVSGTGGAWDLQLGGTPARGLVLGGGIFVNWMESADLRPVGFKPNDDNPGNVVVAAIGPFIDYFPDPKQGFHFGGMIGLAGLGFDVPGYDDTLNDSANDDDDDDETDARAAGGGAVSAWIGYDWWVAREWSLGGQVRYLGVAAENEDYDWEAKADTLMLEFTVLYH